MNNLGDAAAGCDLRLTALTSDCCPDDVNDDGLLDFFDLQAYLNAYSGRCP